VCKSAIALLINFLYFFYTSHVHEPYGLFSATWLDLLKEDEHAEAPYLRKINADAAYATTAVARANLMDCDNGGREERKGTRAVAVL